MNDEERRQDEARRRRRAAEIARLQERGYEEYDRGYEEYDLGYEEYDRGYEEYDRGYEEYDRGYEEYDRGAAGGGTDLGGRRPTRSGRRRRSVATSSSPSSPRSAGPPGASSAPRRRPARRPVHPRAASGAARAGTAWGQEADLACVTVTALGCIPRATVVALLAAALGCASPTPAPDAWLQSGDYERAEAVAAQPLARLGAATAPSAAAPLAALVRARIANGKAARADTVALAERAVRVSRGGDTQSRAAARLALGQVLVATVEFERAIEVTRDAVAALELRDRALSTRRSPAIGSAKRSRRPAGTTRRWRSSRAAFASRRRACRRRGSRSRAPSKPSA